MVRVVPVGAVKSEAVALRRAARALSLKGRVKAVYVRLPDRSGRMLAHLAVGAPDSMVCGNAYPMRSPGWIEIPPPFLVTFDVRTQAVLLAHRSGVPCTPNTAARLAREYREQSAA